MYRKMLENGSGAILKKKNIWKSLVDPSIAILRIVRVTRTGTQVEHILVRAFYSVYLWDKSLSVLPDVRGIWVGLHTANTICTMHTNERDPPKKYRDGSTLSQTFTVRV